MAADALFALLLVGIAGASMMGLVAYLVAMHSEIHGRIAFAWGAVLGPVGVVTVIVVVARSRKVKPSLGQGVPW